MKKMYTLLVLVLGGFLIAYAIYSKKTEGPIAINMVNPIIQTISIATTTDYTIVTGSYPQFGDLPMDFNKKIAEVVGQAIVEHSENSRDNWNAEQNTTASTSATSTKPRPDERFTLDIQSTVVRNDTSAASMIMYINGFSGGAHGYQNIMTFNYDRIHHQEITVQNLSSGDIHFLDKLSIVSRTLLQKDLATRASIPTNEVDHDMLNNGTAPLPINFSTFTLPNDHQAIFYFAPYQVAAWVYGDSKITVDLPLK